MRRVCLSVLGLILLKTPDALAQDAAAHVHPAPAPAAAPAHVHPAPAPAAEPAHVHPAPAPVADQAHVHPAPVPVADQAHVHVEPALATAHDHGTATPAVSGQRDPDAYSDGYTLHEGPYVLSHVPRMEMSDQKSFSGVRLDRLEAAGGADAGHQALEGQLWTGTSYRRVLLRAEAVREDAAWEEGELDLVLSRAVHPFWDVQAGAGISRHHDADRGRVVIGLSGLAPYWFEVDAQLALDENGQLGATLEAELELLITQRLILQPRLDVSAFSKDDREALLGRGLSSVTAGLRLRYEISRQFAPYLGVERGTRLGDSAALLPPGQDRHETRWFAGLRLWF